MTDINPEEKLLFLYCIFHQEVLCKSVLKINHMVDVVSKVVNFIRMRALNHRQFVVQLEEHEARNLIWATTQLSEGSTCKVLKRV